MPSARPLSVACLVLLLAGTGDGRRGRKAPMPTGRNLFMDGRIELKALEEEVA